jgi:hypothetical protein
VDLIDSISITPAKTLIAPQILARKKEARHKPRTSLFLSAHFSVGLAVMVMPMVATVMDSGVRRNDRSHQNNQRNSRKQQST